MKSRKMQLVAHAGDDYCVKPEEKDQLGETDEDTRILLKCITNSCGLRV
jgi:hypothetical protein